MRTKGEPIIGYRTMTGAQRYNARMARIWNSCQEAKTRFNLSSRTERNDDEWSGSCDPCDPANYWIDDETGERVSAATGERSEHDCPMLNADDSLKRRVRQLTTTSNHHARRTNSERDTMAREPDKTACYICVPFGGGPACGKCLQLSTQEREARLTDTLITEIEIEEGTEANARRTN